MRSVTPPVFIAMPARMKQGTASSGKESMPPISRCGAEVIDWPSIISQAKSRQVPLRWAKVVKAIGIKPE